MIFISYSSDDCEFVEALHDVLVLAGYEVWRDRKKIRAGNSFPQEIERALRACSVLLIVVSNSFERSTWQGLELTAAIERQKPIVPIILGAGFERPIELSQFHQIRTRAYQE
ncbi:MAG TPA: toll/interleukin-1 receptor domain-containing protein, partial [Haloferula sp.]